MTGEKVLELLNEGVHDQSAFVRHAIARGTRFTPDEAMDIFYDFGILDVPELFGAIKAPLDVEQLIDVVENASFDVRPLVLATLHAGTSLTFEQLIQLMDDVYDPAFSKTLLTTYLEQPKPLTLDDIRSLDDYVDQDTLLSALAYCDPPLTCDDVYDFCVYCLEEPSVQRISQVLAHSQCTQAEAAQVICDLADDLPLDADLPPIQAQSTAKSYEDFFVGIGALTLLKTLPVFGKPHKSAEQQGFFGTTSFQDFRNAAGSNNDHNWYADGDQRWDDLGLQ